MTIQSCTGTLLVRRRDEQCVSSNSAIIPWRRNGVIAHFFETSSGRNLLLIKFQPFKFVSASLEVRPSRSLSSLATIQADSERLESGRVQVDSGLGF